MKTKLIGLLTGILIITGFTAQAQRGYTEFENEEEIQVMYRWQRSCFLRKNSDAVLNLRLTNPHDSAVNVTFVVGFYNEGLLFYQSDPNTLCLKPGQTRRGGVAGLRFTLEDLKLEDVEDEKFSWDFATFETETIEECP